MRRVLCLALLASCTHRANFGDRDGGPEVDAGPDNFPPPRTDVVPPIGTETTLEIATWNIENFPGAPSTPSMVADLIASMDLDVVMCEEIADEAAWNELLLRLPDHEGVLSTHVYEPGEYQKLGLIYRSSLVTAGAPALLFGSSEFTFPRPPLSVPITVDGATIELIGVHLKAGVGFEDAERRAAAIAALDTHLRAQVDGGGQPEVVLLGDYNERVIDESDRAVLAPILTAPDRYTMRTEPVALAGESTFLGFGGSFIDHVTTTAALDARWTTARIEVAKLHLTVPSYRSTVSDHLPVVLITPR
jgi:endonuclease/exonuclease/phosphatase family metal-dependent hydrolase